MPKSSLSLSLALLACAAGCGHLQQRLGLGGSAGGALEQAALSQAPARSDEPREPGGTGSLEKRPEEGIANPVHQQWLGKIAWSSRPIDKDAPDPGAFRDRFEHVDFIYGRVFMPHSVENHPIYTHEGLGPQAHHNRDGGYTYKVFVDGELVEWPIENRHRSSLPRSRTTQQVLLRPRPEDEATDTDWIELVAGLERGEHRVRVEMWTYQGGYWAKAPIAAGEFTLVKGSDAPLPIGKTFADYERGMDDPALEAKLLDLLRRVAASKGWKESFTDLVIESPEWSPRRHELGYVLARTLVTRARATWPDGHCSAQVFVFEEPYDLQAGRYTGAIRFAGVGIGAGSLEHIDCSAQPAAEPEPAVAPEPAGEPEPAAAAEPEPAPAAEPEAAPEPAPAATTEAEPAAAPEPVAAPEPAAAATAPAVTAAPEAAAEPAPTAPQVAAAAPAAASTTATPALTASATQQAAGAPRLSLALGTGLNARAADAGLAGYAAVSARLSRFELSAGATYPLEVMAGLRFLALDGPIELGPSLAVIGLLEDEADRRDLALAAGLMLGYRVSVGSMWLGARLEGLASFNLDGSTVAVPVLASTVVGF